MNAVVQPERLLCPMRDSDLDAVLAIEQAGYDFPWTRGNFLDSLRAGYLMQVLVTPQAGVAGYFVALAGVDELHLLNLSVAPALQGRGHGRYMLDALRAMARERRALQLWLEVRISNARARALYERYGFRSVGLRRSYYPARGRQREDAVVMSMQIPESVHGLDERQIAMLAELGVRLWPHPEPAQHGAAVPAELGLPPFPPAELGGGEAGASQDGASVGAAAGGVAAMDWPALHAAVAACTACALCASRRNTVFGVGHRQAHWMIVGEAPGEQEDERGEPFVGKAGQLLDNMLAALGLSRAAEGEPAERVFIANVLKCRPPGNRNPLPEEVAQCAPFLERQVALLRPRLILALGRFAVNALLASDEPIGRLRGRVHRYRGVPVVVSYHPAYLLRNPADKARAWDDLCLARETMLAALG